MVNSGGLRDFFILFRSSKRSRDDEAEVRQAVDECAAAVGRVVVELSAVTDLLLPVLRGEVRASAYTRAHPREQIYIQGRQNDSPLCIIVPLYVTHKNYPVPSRSVPSRTIRSRPRGKNNEGFWRV